MNKIKQRLDEMRKPYCLSTDKPIDLLRIIELQAETLEFYGKIESWKNVGCKQMFARYDDMELIEVYDSMRLDVEDQITVAGARAREALEQTAKLLGVE